MRLGFGKMGIGHWIGVEDLDWNSGLGIGIGDRGLLLGMGNNMGIGIRIGLGILIRRLEIRIRD